MYNEAREAFEIVLRDEPDNPKVLLQLGYIFSLPDERDRPNPVRDLDRAYGYIDRALQIDPKDPHAWYTLGRYFMQRGNYGKAYEAYQQAVYRDSRNSNFWCSIGVLYWEINQYRDALDAYTRAIRLNPYVPEIWFNLGTLYEACNNQIQDAIDAYNRAYELDNNYHLVEQRLRYLKSVLETGRNDSGPPPRPEDIDPQRYEDFVQGQQHSLQQSQLSQVAGPMPNQWGPNPGAAPSSGAPPINPRSMHPQQPPQQPPYPPRRSPDHMKPTPYSHPQSYSNAGGSYTRPGPAPPGTGKRGSSPPPPPPYGYDSRPPISELQHQGYQRHDDMGHRPPPIHQGYASPRQHDRDIGGPGGMGSSYPPPASRSPISTYNRPRSPPQPHPVSQHGPPPDVKPSMDQGPPISPGGTHNIQLAPLQGVRSPPTNIPSVPRNDTIPFPPMNEAPKRWEPEPRDYPRPDLSRTSPRLRPEDQRRPSQDRPEERRPSPPQPQHPSHDPTPRPRSPLISPRTSYLPGPPPAPERKSPPGSSMKMDIDPPADKGDHRHVLHGDEGEKMHVEEDKRPEAEAPARAMDVDEDYDKEEESKPEDK
jgi:general transcriptional corepressor CYC8